MCQKPICKTCMTWRTYREQSQELPAFSALEISTQTCSHLFKMILGPHLPAKATIMNDVNCFAPPPSCSAPTFRLQKLVGISISASHPPAFYVASLKVALSHQPVDARKEINLACLPSLISPSPPPTQTLSRAWSGLASSRTMLL